MVITPLGNAMAILPAEDSRRSGTFPGFGEADHFRQVGPVGLREPEVAGKAGAGAGEYGDWVVAV